jgi:hypothetical protein
VKVRVGTLSESHSEPPPVLVPAARLRLEGSMLDRARGRPGPGPAEAVGRATLGSPDWARPAGKGCGTLGPGTPGTQAQAGPDSQKAECRGNWAKIAGPGPARREPGRPLGAGGPDCGGSRRSDGAQHMSLHSGIGCASLCRTEERPKKRTARKGLSPGAVKALADGRRICECERIRAPPRDRSESAPTPRRPRFTTRPAGHPAGGTETRRAS